MSEPSTIDSDQRWQSYPAAESNPNPGYSILIDDTIAVGGDQRSSVPRFQPTSSHGHSRASERPMAMHSARKAAARPPSS
eukprot:1380217-Prymnesium_polylepis.1